MSEIPNTGRPTDFTTLTAAQADGLACVECGKNFTTTAAPSVPVGRSSTGSQVFACEARCAGALSLRGER
jgi:hypothetical protein